MMHENLGNLGSLGSLGRVFCVSAKFLNFPNFPKKNSVLHKPWNTLFFREQGRCQKSLVIRILNLLHCNCNQDRIVVGHI